MAEYKTKIKKWMRYVDNIQFIWENNDEELQRFLKEINHLGKNISFKMETENKEINFLDLNIQISGNNKLIFEVCRKSMNMDVIQNG